MTSDRAPFSGLLTPREREVLKLYAHGYSRKQIAAALGVKSTTARTYVDRLGAHFKGHRADRAELVRWAAGLGLLDDLVLGPP